MGGIGGLASIYSDQFSPSPIMRPNENKYELWITKEEGEYLLLISGYNFEKQFDSEPTPDYNVVITVMGPRQEIAGQIMTEVQGKIEIEMELPPQSLKKQFDEMLALVEENVSMASSTK